VAQLVGHQALDAGSNRCPDEVAPAEVLPNTVIAKATDSRHRTTQASSITKHWQ